MPVHDASAARRFYGEVLGLPLLAAITGDDWGGRPWLMMIFTFGAGGQHLVATALAKIDTMPLSPFPRDARHVALAVDDHDAWTKWKARLQEARADFWEEDHGDQRSLYVVDPSGSVLEIATPASRAITASPDASAVVDRWLATHAR